MPVSIATSLETSARPATLWRVLTDSRHWAEALPDLAEAEVVPAGPLAVGSVITTARHQPGRTPRRFTFTVEESEPERRLALSGRGRGHRSIVMYEIEPRPAGAEVRVAMTIEGANLLASVVISLFAGYYSRHMAPLVEARSRALVALAERLEGASS